MKKIFTLLTLLLATVGGATSAWADAVTIGLTQAIDGTEVTKSSVTYKGTLAAAAYTGTTNVSVAEAHGAGCGINQSERKTTGSDGDYWASKCFRKTVNSSTWDATEWVGYTMTVASGYKVSLTNIRATLWDANSSASYTWRVIVENASGTALYTSGNKTSSTSSIGTLSVASPTGVSELKTGTYTVKMQIYQAGGNKYFTVPYLTVDATVEEDNSTSYTVTVSAGNGGTVSPSGTNNVLEGASIAITATPNTGYGFLNWTVDDADGGTTNPLTLTNVTANHTVSANFKQLYSISYNVDGANKGTSTNVLVNEYANVSDKWTATRNYYAFSEGKTLTKWNDGANDYVPGTEYTLAGNITVSPVFEANTKYLNDFTAETTISWPFGTSEGAPTLNCEGNTQYYVQQTTIAGNKVDVPIFVNTENNYGINGKKGKFVTSGTSYVQVNAGTVFKIPAVKGMVVKYMTNQTTQVSNIGFTDDTNDLGGDGSALTAPTVISNDNKTISYTYTGTADYLYLVDKAGGKYPTGLSVTYPEKQTKYIAPTITVGDFSFADKAYPVTITAAEGTLEVSTDGTIYTAQTSPYQVNVTATTHFYAKATGNSFDPSDVVDENVVCTFDNAKKYVAWVYESNYANAPSNYNIANDAIHTELGTIYNVVDVDIKDYKSAITDAQKTAMNGNLDDADLVVISEATSGSSKGLTALKDLVGTVPMLSMKLFSYSNGRWAWGTPKNADKGIVSIKPVSNYKVLEGVTFTNDTISLFDYPNAQNHIQYVDSWTAEPAGDVVLAKTGDKPAMHASTSQKYFALGLSCDDFTKYNTNAVTIVKNAAAMLIAGENLDAVNPITITPAKEYTTYITPYAMDFTGLDLKAFVATSSTTNSVTLDEVTTVPAGTALVLKKGSAASYDVPMAASASAPATNLLKGSATETYTVANDGDAYVLSNGAFHPVNAGTLAAGKAYILKADVPSNAPFLNLDFGGTTGINDVRSKMSDVRGDFFDLQGRKVAQPTKGLYIVNGRKVVIK